jgi:hypothetical protein
MRTHLMIATAAAAALLAGAAYAQDTAVNPNPNALPEGVATGNAATSAPGEKTLPPDSTAPTASSTQAGPPVDTTVAPAAGAPTERAPAASVGGTDVVTNGPVPDT